jgi:multisubunit Na+/H+ antiporter MnhC subunit
MTTVLIGLAITAMIVVVSVVIASWHHECLQDEFAKGWDSAIEFMKRD